MQQHMAARPQNPVLFAKLREHGARSMPCLAAQFHDNVTKLAFQGVATHLARYAELTPFLNQFVTRGHLS